MLTNRITRIKVIENGKQVKSIPNATINYNLDFNSLKKMIRLAIRLSPQDPLYDVDQIIVNTKSNEEVAMSEAEIDVAKSIISQASSAAAIINGEAITLTVKTLRLMYISFNS